MKPIDAPMLDMFPTAEAIFKDNYDVIRLLENRRRNMIFVFIITSLVIGLFSFFATPFILPLRSGPSPDMRFSLQLLYAIIAALCFIPVQYSFIDGLYRQLAKRKCLDIIAGSLKMTYRRGGYFYLTDIYDHHILPPYTKRRVEEGFSGKFKGFKIEFQDFFISSARRCLEGASFRSLPLLGRYYGLAMKVELNKRFAYHTVLLPAKEQKRFLASLPNANLFLHEDVNLVYHNFTRHYVCLSTHQVEARYILDPAVMERFARLAESFDTDLISASFMGNEMVVVMRPLLNLFEVGSLRDPVTVLTIERTLMQIHTLRQMAEIFELNDKVGLGAAVTGRID
ncbi:MAG: DUF3137 domain-containing protein [Micavibrio aeruginosavorus]|uniref:DUF3137 domain-containing protein n=1 Tax=Micavibrio aeruginosavorus TaxID=349221 RepID=A0A7T5UG57_9BACT|nr:MAG: DUF3137 domain-containing protein [Micavibrio aeruginosavorus]